MWQSLASLLTNKYFVAIASPMLLLVLGALGKAVVRRKFDRTVWFLGFEAALTALYAGMVYLYDVARDKQLLDDGTKLTILAGFLLWSFVTFMMVTLFHMFWEHEDNRLKKPVRQFLLLGIVSNALGFGLLLAFVLLVKGVS
jgi:hypothetical protein